MTVIAMTREMATLGKDVAAGLASRLGLEVVHHQLVEHDIATLGGLRESEVHRFLEGESTLLESWRIDRHKLSRYTTQEILELAARGNVLIRGWGATYLLRSVPHVVTVRICAPMRFRLRVLMKRLGITDPNAARREIEQSDAAHNGTMQQLFATDWHDPTLYAITLNTEQVTPEECVEHIVTLTKSYRFRETPESRTALMDELIAARVRAKLAERLDASPKAIGLDLAVTNGKVVLSGASADQRVIADIVREVQTVAGVTAVESRIHHLAFVPGI